MKKLFALTVLVICMCFVGVLANAEELYVTYTEGIFQVKIPLNYTKVTGSLLDELKKMMLEGERELADESKTAESSGIDEEWLSFFSVFRNPSRNLMIELMGAGQEPNVDRDEMCKTNTQRITWGIESGRLSKRSKGVSKTMIDNVPCLLMDIETINGARLLTYSFFAPKYPQYSFQDAISCDDLTCYENNKNDIEAIIKSIKVTKKGQ